ncbi:hypothetical protein TNCV_3650241 [Trichonephila clavipes]|uniref:Uncharacterized protein n=1 Tax=Trichonephila clavipes TaxID=2585209 RepID=A0A8X6S4X4_TRICX|nr:hypothetical protein TNCV_3650241 [Trichonephila clavipes]
MANKCWPASLMGDRSGVRADHCDIRVHSISWKVRAVWQHALMLCKLVESSFIERYGTDLEFTHPKDNNISKKYWAVRLHTITASVELV